jgi:hypothetical protein
MRACDAVRRAAGPHRQVQPFLSGCGLGSRWISPSIDQICVRSRSDSTLRGELPTARCGPRITFVISKWTTRKVDQVPNTEASANLPQLGSGGRKETALQSIPAEPLHPPSSTPTCWRSRMTVGRPYRSRPLPGLIKSQIRRILPEILWPQIEGK